MDKAMSESFYETLASSPSSSWLENCGLSSSRGSCFPGNDNTRVANVARNEGRTSSAGSELGRRAADKATDGISGARQPRDVRQELELLAAKLACSGFFLKTRGPASDMVRRAIDVRASGVSDAIPSRNPYEPVLILESNKPGQDIALTNGDHFRVSAAGQILWTDSRGLPIKQVRRVDNDMIPGNATYEMSNGAKYNSGCFADSITYPNGDTISFSRSGNVTSATVRGRKLI